MLLLEAKAEPLQSFGLCRCNLVRAAHRVPQLDEKAGQTAHPASGNPDKMNFMLFGGQKSRQFGQRIPTPRFFA
jgi:hypothetical protein